MADNFHDWYRVLLRVPAIIWLVANPFLFVMLFTYSSEWYLMMPLLIINTWLIVFSPD